MQTVCQTKTLSRESGVRMQQCGCITQHPAPNDIRAIQSRRMRWIMHVPLTGRQAWYVHKIMDRAADWRKITGLDSPGSGQKTIVGYCQHNYVSWGSTQEMECLDQMWNYQLLNEDSFPQSYSKKRNFDRSRTNTTIIFQKCENKVQYNTIQYQRMISCGNDY
jgi:hypothetical protein